MDFNDYFKYFKFFWEEEYGIEIKGEILIFSFYFVVKKVIILLESVEMFKFN